MGHHVHIWDIMNQVPQYTHSELVVNGKGFVSKNQPTTSQ